MLRADRTTETAPRPEIPGAWILALLVVGAAARLIALERQSFWYDEAVSVVVARHSLADLVSGRSKDLGNPNLYPVLLHLWMRIFGERDGVVRALSALLGIATVPLVYSVGRRLVSSQGAFVGTVLFALAPLHLQMAQEARTYTLLTLTGVATVWALLRALEAPTAWRWWLLAGVAMGAMVLSHYFGFCLAAAAAVYLGVRYRRDRLVLERGLVMFLVAGLAFAPWLPSLLAQLAVKGNLARAKESWYLHVVATPLVFGAGSTLVWKDSATPLRLAAGLAAALTFVVALAAGLWRTRREPGFLLLVLWLVLPVALPAAASALASPIYSTRYVILASVPFYLLVGAGLCALPRRAQVAAGVVVGAAMLASQATYVVGPSKHQWREAAAYIEERLAPGDVLLFDTDFNETAYKHYARRPELRIRLLPPPEDAPDALYGIVGYGAGEGTDMSEEVRSHDRAWLVLSDAPPDAIERARRFLADWQPEEKTELRGITIERYRQPKAGSDSRPPFPRSGDGRDDGGRAATG